MGFPEDPSHKYIYRDSPTDKDNLEGMTSLVPIIDTNHVSAAQKDLPRRCSMVLARRSCTQALKLFIVQVFYHPYTASIVLYQGITPLFFFLIEKAHLQPLESQPVVMKLAENRLARSCILRQTKP
jgi:hypothetical protein